MALININTLPSVSSVEDTQVVNVYRATIPFAATILQVSEYIDGSTELIEDTDTFLIASKSTGRARYVTAANFKTYIENATGIKSTDVLIVIESGVLKKATVLAVKSYINPVEFTRTTSGLIYKDDFTSLTGWVGDTSEFEINTEDPVAVPFAPLENYPFDSTSGDEDDYGCRQGTPYIESGVWFNLYDGGGSASQSDWASNKAISNNRGRTWTRTFKFGPGYDNGSGGEWLATAMGFIAKFGSTYYLYRVTINSPSGPPYGGDIWSASDINGTWTFQYTLPLGVGTFTSVENLPGSIVKVGSTYHLFIQGRGATGEYTIGRMSASNPAGPFTLDTTPILDKDDIDGVDIPENPKCFFSTALNRWVLLINTYVNGVRSERTYALYSTSVTDWSAAVLKCFHRECPMDGDPAIGVTTHFTGPEAAVIVGDNGFIPVMYDGDGTISSIGGSDFAYGRKIKGVLLEPSPACLKFIGSVTGTSKKIFKAQANGNFIAEFGVEFPDATLNKSIGFWYRSDSTGANGYLMLVRSGQPIVLYKSVASSFTLIGGVNEGLLNPVGKMVHRVRLEVSGTSHKCYLDGELQVDITDAEFSSGTHVGVNSFDAVDGKMRLLSLRTLDDITISGCTPGTTVVLRADGKLPVAEGTVNGGGNITLSADHYPLETIEIDGVDYTPAGGIWGGDEYTLS